MFVPKPTMTENIKSMFSKMNDETRAEAIKCLRKEFNLDSSTRIKNTWLIGGRIPPAYQERIVHIFQILLRQQTLKIREIVVNF